MPRDRNEPVRLTKIYTRGGDAGKTSLGDGSRTSKLDPRIRAYGIVDELNSQLGVVLAGDVPDERLRATQAMVDELERLCDEHNADLEDLRSFVLPGGTEAAAQLHVARTIARRAELAALEADVNPLARVYLNRVSDLLFIVARRANALAGVEEPLWRPGD
jgi:cob(I)alamin adenosyltransferase